MGRYRWVWRNTGKSERLFQVGILADGSLYNPNNYPEDVVRAAVLAADARRLERRSRTAKQAAETRQNRQRAKVYIVARRVVVGQGIGPQDHCYVCGRALEDPQSIARGIGSECWQGVLAAAEAVRGAA